jgi:hypothetical protein
VVRPWILDKARGVVRLKPEGPVPPGFPAAHPLDHRKAVGPPRPPPEGRLPSRVPGDEDRGDGPRSQNVWASLRVRRVRCPDATRPPSRPARRLTAAPRRPAPVLEGATSRRSVPGRTRRPSTRAGGDAPRFAARAGCASRTVSSRHRQEQPSRCLLRPVGASALHDGGTAGTERLHALRLQAGSGTTIRLMTTWARAYRRATIVRIRGAHVQHELAPTRPSSSTPGTS